MKIYFLDIFRDGSLIRESAGLGRVFLLKVLFLEVSFRMDCDLVPKESSKRHHVLTYTQVLVSFHEVFLMFPKD